jgi:manganese transport protein
MPNEAALYNMLLELLSYGYATQFILTSPWYKPENSRTTAGIKQALKYNFIDSTIALNLAF